MELQVHQVANASGANMLAFEQGQLSGRTAENTGGLVLLQNDLIILSEDLQLVTFSDIQHSTQFDRQYDSTEFVDLPDNACRFHV